jgi:hypothetical protein
MTDPTGLSFLSYKRERKQEAALVIAAQHDHGIPTWQDVVNLEHKHTVSELRQVLDDPRTANAILWITPEVAASETIKQIEAPAILKRVQAGDGFFMVPVAAGGLSYGQAADIAGEHFAINDLREWNLYKLENEPLTPAEAAMISESVLRKRIDANDKSLSASDPLRVELHTRGEPALRAGIGLLLDWRARFNGLEAKPGAWDEYLMPALRSVGRAIQSKAPDRTVEASGLCFIPAAVALGCVFISRGEVKIAWKQKMISGDYQTWSIEAKREESGFKAETIDRNLNAKDIAVLVSVADNVEPAFGATFMNPVPFRSLIKVSKPGGDKHELATPGQAVDVANKVIDATRRARSTLGKVGRIHLFMAVPAGLAMMIGQLLNTFDAIQTYQHIPGKGCYRPAALLNPSF